MENENWAAVKDNPSAPYLNGALLPTASYCDQYYNPPALHPSLPNYLWLEAGTNFGILDDNPPATDHLSATNHLVTLLNHAGISWKTYQEDISGDEVPLEDTNHYLVHHNPFAYFDDVTGTNDPANVYGISHIRPYAELAADLADQNIARYNFITPNTYDDGHTPEPPANDEVHQIDAWLAAQIPLIQGSAAYTQAGAIFIVWDEGEGGDGPIGMIVLSPQARGGGYHNSIYYTHSSLLRTVEEIFGITPLLGDAANAPDLSDLFTQYSISSAIFTADGNFQLNVVGVTPGKTNLLQASADLSTWISISTNVSITNDLTVLDSAATNSPQRYYRFEQVP